MALSLGNNTNFLIPKANSSLTGQLDLNSSDSLKLEFTPSKTGYYIFDFSQQENAFTSPAYSLLADNNNNNSYMLGQMMTFNYRASPLVELTSGQKYYLILRHVDSSYYGSYINITISEGYKFTATINPSGVARFTTPSVQIVKVGEKVNFNPLLLDNSYMLNNWTKDGNILPEVSWGLTLTASKNNHGEYIANFIKKPPDPVYYEVDLTAYPSNYGEAVILEEGDDYGKFLEGTPITLFANPKLGSYAFQGWYLDSTYAESKLVSTELKYSTVVTKDINYYAKFQVINSISLNKEQTYTMLQKNQRINISYNPTSAASEKPVIFETTGDVALSGQLYVYNSGWSLLRTVIKTGEKKEYTFPSNANQNTYLLSIVCDEELDTKKSFNFSSYIKNYNVTFIVDNNIYATQKKIYDTNLTLSSETPSKVGYTFKGWGTTSTSTTASYQPGGTYSYNSDLTLYAIWIKNNYTITAQPNDTSYGTVSNSGGTYSYNSKFTSTATPYTNYKFDGWYKNGSLVTSDAQLSEIVYGEATYTAQFSRKQCTITYEPNGGTSTPDPQKFYAGDSVKLASAIQKNSTITNLSYDFSIDFYKQGGIWANGATTLNQIINPKKETSYTFGYWYDGSFNYQAGYSYTLSENKTFMATWDQSHSYTVTAPTVSRNDSTNSRTITFHYNDGTTNKSTATSSNTTSYTLKGWYTSASGGDKKISSNGGSYNPTSGEKLYAQWNSSSTAYSKVTFPKFRKDGYTLKGFATSPISTSVEYEAEQEVAVNSVDWYAIWEPNILIISLDNKDATTNGTSTLYLKYDKGWYSNLSATTSISQIKVPKRTGYTFQGYYTEENGEGTKIIDNAGKIVGTNNFTLDDITLYVHWTINYYSITHSMNTDTSTGNIYTVKNKSNNSIPSGSTYAYGSQVKLEATGNNLQGYDFLRWEINGSSVAASSYTFKLTQDTTIKAYFGKRDMSIIVNLYDENNKPSSISPEEEDSHIKLWIRQLNDDDTYSSWEKKYFNAPIVYSQATKIQVIIQDGEDYEFVSSNNDKFNKYTDILVNTEITFSVYFKKIPEINSIYFGKSDKPYTSGYIDDPNLSFKEEISSIWVGNKQIMGKAPKRDYPYLEDTLLGNTLYIGKNNSFINSYKNNLNIYKVIIPEGIFNTGGDGFFGCSNLTSVILPKSLKNIGQHVFEETGLKSLYLPDQVETLYIRALHNMYSLEKIVFSKNLKIIYANNTSNSKVSTINLFDTNLEILKTGAFRSLNKLTTVLLPDTLQSIEEEAFSSCYNLKKVIYKGTIEEWQNISIAVNKNEYLLNATIYCKDGIINPKEEN